MLTDLTPFNSYGISSFAEICYFPTNYDDLIRYVRAARGAARRIVVLGRGNNVILKNDRYGDDTAVFIMSRYQTKVFSEGDALFVGSGASLSRVCVAAARSHLSGFEKLWGIPSSIGGAIYMNAGAFGSSVGDHLESVRVLDTKTMCEFVLSREEVEIEYRHSIFQQQERRHWIVLGATFRLLHRNRDAIRKEMRGVGLERTKRFPSKSRNAGSVFRRPEAGPSVGVMMETLGLKGLTIGGACISHKHGGFIENIGGANAAQVHAVAEEMRKAAKQHFGIDLVMEQVSI